MKKLTISIDSKDFDIKLDGEFAEYFEKHFKETFLEGRKVETKELLWAYVQKCYDEYLNNLEIKKIYDKLEGL
ncbi:MAG: hypothetical protein PWQ42_933 [Sulfurospirillum sp.]|jgi:hypothetical protein|nr:hypothetical protein [Sulfurospirillum sp.]DAB33918.1 MAG TPA: hypothetical protein CFH82_08085 [Sulfurospirillum sp. UBA12182]